MNATVHKDGKLQEIKATIETSKSQPTLSPSWMIDFRGRVKFEWELDVLRRPATSHDITRRESPARWVVVVFFRGSYQANNKLYRWQ